MKDTDKTVGKYSYELQQKPDPKINAIDLQREIHKGANSKLSYEDQVRVAVERGRKLLDGAFYVVVLSKKERIMHNVVRQYFFPRKSCPLPEYDQVVYKYSVSDDKLDFIWVIPDKGTVLSLPLVREAIPKDQEQLYQYISDFRSGKLDKLSDELNKSFSIA